MLCRNHVFFEETEVCSVPGVVTIEEWNNGNPRQGLIEELYKNLVQSGTFLAKEKLGLG